MRSLVRAADDGIDDEVFTQQHVVLLKTAAELPHVDRIFVNKLIKQRLCQSVTGNPSERENATLPTRRTPSMSAAATTAAEPGPPTSAPSSAIGSASVTTEKK